MKRRLATATVASLALSSASFGALWAMPKDDFGGAVPLNKKGWITADDYPDKAALWHQQGYLTVSFTIGTDGRMTNCKVIRSSGYPLLDEMPCRILTKRARFAPAKDSAGALVTTHGTTSIGFSSPQ